jgi:hypothetical protein
MGQSALPFCQKCRQTEICLAHLAFTVDIFRTWPQYFGTEQKYPVHFEDTVCLVWLSVFIYHTIPRIRNSLSSEMYEYFMKRSKNTPHFMYKTFLA